MRKYEEIGQPDSTLNKCDPVEPIFILRAQDNLADAAVMEWIRQAEEAGVNPEKIEHARLMADLIKRWPTRKIPD